MFLEIKKMELESTQICKVTLENMFYWCTVALQAEYHFKNEKKSKFK